MSACTSGVKALLLLLGVAFVLSGMDCNGTGPNPTPLARPRWECPQPPTSEQEGGIGSAPGDNFIHLRWIIGDDPDLVGYYLYRRVSTDLIDTLYTTIPLTREQLAKRGSVIEWVDRNVELKTMYYYVLFAYDSEGNRSMRSDTAAYALLEKPLQYEPKAGAVVNDSLPIFTFGPRSTAINVSSFVVRVATDSADSRIVWISPRLPLQGYGYWEKTHVQYGSGGFIRRSSLVPGRYRWRVDFQGFLRDEAWAPEGCVYDTTRYPDADPSLPTPEELSFVGSKSEWWPFTVAP